MLQVARRFRTMPSALVYLCTTCLLPVLDAISEQEGAVWIRFSSGEEGKFGAADLGRMPEAGGALYSSAEIQHLVSLCGHHTRKKASVASFGKHRGSTSC